jgi:photosystem II stability/assembly factor-like uncharacterized protein
MVQQDDGISAVERTDDGGATWSLLPEVPLNAPGAGVATWFLDADHGWAWTFEGMNSATGDLVATDDGGTIWTEVAQHPAISGVLGFQTPLVGWATASHAGAALATAGPVPFPTGPNLSGLLYATRDGGRSWAFVQLPLLKGEAEGDRVNPLVAPLFATDDAGYFPVISTSNHHAGALVGTYTTQDGQTWSANLPLTLATDDSAAPHAFLPDGHGWLQAKDQLAATDDAGAHWVLFAPEGLPIAPDGRNLHALEFVDAVTGWALMGPPQRPDARQDLYETTDAGRDWFQVSAEIG